MNKRLTREACIKIIEQAERTEAEFADCFTAAVTGDSMHDIYKVRYPRCSAKIYDGNHKNAQKSICNSRKASFKSFLGHFLVPPRPPKTVHSDSFDDKAGSIILIE